MRFPRWHNGIIFGLLLLWLADAVSAPGFLYRITRADLPPSYLVGTMHVDNPQVTQVLPRIRPVLAECRLLLVELVPDGPAMLAAAQAGMLPAGQRLSDLVDADLYREVRRLTAERGVPEVVLQRLRPWTVATTLSLPPDGSDNFFDLRLYQMALELSVPVGGLERVDEQLAVFQSLTGEQQILLLRHAVKESGELPQRYAELVTSYVRGDLQGLQMLGEQESARLPPDLASWFGDTLLVDRNARMLQRLLPELASGGVMAAVGALHLPGTDGLLEGLRSAGYQVQEWH